MDQVDQQKASQLSSFERVKYSLAKWVCDGLEPSIKKNVLFLCAGNSCCSQIAEGWTKCLGSDVAEVTSAGLNAYGLSPNAVKVMQEVGVDIANQESKVVTPDMMHWADIIVNVCEDPENCPKMPVKKEKIHWPIEDPEKEANTTDEIQQYEKTRDKIHDLTERLIKNLRHNINQKIALGIVGIVGAAVTFTLDVLGAAGAFWGATDVFQLRNEKNAYVFRNVAIFIGALSLFRYISIHLLSPHKQRNYIKDIEQEGALGKIFQALENPVPAMKTSMISLIYKVARFTKDNTEKPEKSALQ